jgi:hypothetical protein
MVRTTWMVVIFLALALAPFASAQSAAHHKSRKAKPAKQVVLPPLPAGPLQQVPLDQLPAVPPHVNYQDGSLTIVAENSTLGDILREVRKRTGASIDVPGNAAERVATRLGPGPARDILATLLNGTSFNYVMVGSTSDPTALSSVVLTPRPGGSAVQTAQAQPAPVYTAPDFGPGTGRPGFVPPQPAPVQTADNEDDKDDDDADNSDQDQQAQGQPGTPVPGVPQVPPSDGTDPNGQPNAGPRTPQQILQMLQQQRQQLQQQQQQQQNQDQPPPQEQ